MRAIVKQGKGPMPSFARIPDATLDSLLAYLFHPAGAPASPETENHAAMTSPAGARYRSGFGFMFTEDGLPAIKPPWTTLTAYDLNSGTLQWQIPLGEVPELAARESRIPVRIMLNRLPSSPLVV